MAGFIANSNIALILTLGLFGCVTLVGADGEPNEKSGTDSSMLPSSDDVSSKHFANIEQILGHEHATNIERRLPPIEAMLQTTLKSFPQDEQGRYGHMAVRHTLHRFFLKKHGWHMLGLDNNGEPSSGAALPENLPDYVRGPLEARLDSHGLTTHETALLAAALENLVNRETMKYFEQAFVVMGMSASTNVLPIKTADSLIATFMAMYIQGFDLAFLRRRTMFLRAWLMKNIVARYVSCPEVRSFASETLMESAGTSETITKDELREVVEHIVDGYGRFQNQECDAMKTRLLSLEDEEGQGRVPLGAFYKLSLEENAPFNESRAYLQHIGVLEEAQTDTPRLLVSNYVLSFANCLGISAYYTQCCITECDNILEHLEREIAAPDAEPDRIEALVQSFSSMYAPASSALQPKLVQRLRSIADANNGRVILHSRAFALWLHQVFPRECPYPHVWNGSRPMDRLSFAKVTGLSVEAGLQEMRAVAEKLQSKSAPPPAMHRADDDAHWSNEDEFYAQFKPLAERADSSSLWIGAFAVLSAVALFLAALAVNSLIEKRESGPGCEGLDTSQKTELVSV
eukprot:TRINITY_DN7848_c0_g1_i1.p1 TRINITY_DN7848_c0_g1~~TRINITY_DN7848_c0_g1_i1.p1  ORF type:complete len:573 (+),score=97.32 TRINITY_DN7848_c0_g1_i1:68-1786(+)